MKCGKCRNTGVTLDHVRNCYGRGGVATATRPTQGTNDAYEGTQATGNPDWDRAEDQATNAVLAAGSPERVGNHHDASGASTRPRNDWAVVNTLRAGAAKLLVRETRGYRVAYFALRAEGDVIKYYRAKYMVAGRHKGKFFLDAKGGPGYYPVRNPGTLAGVLTKFLQNPEAAFHLFADTLGACSRCGLDLTDDTSRALSMGPECRKK